MEIMEQSDIHSIFEKAFNDQDIFKSRLDVLETGGSVLSELGSHAHIHGFVVGDKNISAFAILCGLAADLVVGFAQLISNKHTYAAAALLRQLVEFEYLFFIGYLNKEELGKWLEADDDSLRREFTPQKMRKKSDGLFKDQEYWMHCSMGGHPNPKARHFLNGHTNLTNIEAYILPDGVHHFRRMWTSIKLLYPILFSENLAKAKLLEEISDKIKTWEQLEHDLILFFDGMQHTHTDDEQ